MCWRWEVTVIKMQSRDSGADTVCPTKAFSFFPHVKKPQNTGHYLKYLLWNKSKNRIRQNWHRITKFYILLSVHLVMILDKWPTWRTILFYIFISTVYMFLATQCSSSGETIVSIQLLVYVTLSRWPFHVQVGNELSDLHS